jgi:predicted nucleic acid-binding protein
VIVLDTNVVSETMRPAPAAIVLDWLASRQNELYTSTVTLAEVLHGIEILSDARRRRDLLAGAERMFTQVLSGRILPFDEPAARAFAQIVSMRRNLGRPIAEFDAQIAAIARANEATLATRNTADFEGCGVHVVNPWLE